MKLACVGSRYFNDYEYIEKKILELYDINSISHIISGGAMGVDKLAERFAEKHHKSTTIYLPDWNKYGKYAGYLRNQKIVNECDEVIAFWDGSSKGTKLTIDLARKHNKPIVIVSVNHI